MPQAIRMLGDGITTLLLLICPTGFCRTVVNSTSSTPSDCHPLTRCSFVQKPVFLTKRQTSSGTGGWTGDDSLIRKLVWTKEWDSSSVGVTTNVKFFGLRSAKHQGLRDVEYPLLFYAREAGNTDFHLHFVQVRTLHNKSLRQGLCNRA